MYQNRARWLDTRTGRFVSVDPAEGDEELPITFAPYLYGAANPVLYVDANGEMFSLVGLMLSLTIHSVQNAVAMPAPTRPAFNDTLHLIRFIPLVSAEHAAIQEIVREAGKAPPMTVKMAGLGGRSGSGAVRHMQAAIDDPNMKGTVVLGHAALSGKMWEVAPNRQRRIKGKSICPVGYSDRYGCTTTLSGRDSSLPAPERVWLLGCHTGVLHSQWAGTFRIDPKNLQTTSGYSAGSDPCIAKGTCEPTVPQLNAVIDWIKERRRRGAR